MSQVETPKAEGETPKVEGTTETPVVKPAAEGEKPKADGQQPTGDAAKAGDATVKEGAANADGSVKPDGEKPKAPDTYTLTAPDGMDAEELKAFETFARERGLTNEQAAAALEALPDALASQVSRFRADVEKHPEVGGDKLQAAQANALKALDHFLPADTPEGKALRRGLDVSGYGNYAPLVVLLARIGKAMGEDGGVGTVKAAAGKGGGDKKDAATLLYGDTAPKT